MATSSVTNNAGVVNTSSAGTTYLPGSFSGINTSAIIQNAINARLVPKKHLDTQISGNLNKITAYQALQSQGNQLKGLFDSLKSDLAGNVFAGKQVTYSSSSSTAPANILSATVTKDALPGSHDVVVRRTAQPFSASGTDQTSITTPIGLDGTFNIKLGATATLHETAAATISITSTDTLQTLRNKINAQSATSGVSADIIQVASSTYRLVIKGSQSAQPVVIENFAGKDVLQAVGLLDTSNNFTNITQTAQEAQITLDGTTITSNTNHFDNLLTGLSLDVTSQDTSTTIKLTVGNNTSGVKSAIQGIVDGYNALLKTINEDQAVNADGTVADTAYLFGEYQNSSFGQRLTQTIAGRFGSGIYNGLKSLGISINSANELEINDAKLTDAIQNHYDDVRSVFETKGTSVGLADTASALINSYTNFVNGSISVQVRSLQTINADLTQKSDDIQTAVNNYQLELINTYANLEAKLKQADTTKKQILAILDANKNS